MEDKDRVATIAIICHEANKIYCESLGDNSQESWEDAPEWQRASAIDGVQKQRCRLKVQPL